VAIFAIDPPAAWGVYEACRELGLRIPQDVSIVGFEDSEIAHTMRPPMTIAAQRTDEIGRAAVELLVERFESPPPDQDGRRSYKHVVIDVDLIERESVARASGD
jgi:LacI family transcriptional regulator